MSATRKGAGARFLTAWTPAAILGMGMLLAGGARLQAEPGLRADLHSVVPSALGAYQGRDLAIPESERQVAGMTTYLYRSYAPVSPAAGPPFTVYVGYYASQAYGRTIHSPKNCLPGAGWQALTSQQVAVATAAGTVLVNYYLLQNGERRSLALYWYQGRGRVESNEYRVKWDLLRDAALRGRTEEALVRIVVPIGSDDRALPTAVEVARTMIPAIDAALPV